MQNLKLVKKNYRQIAKVRTGVDRNGNISSVYILLHNPEIHQYTKKLFFTIEDFVEIFGQPVEFTTAGISSACVGTWVNLAEYVELLTEEPEQVKTLFN